MLEDGIHRGVSFADYYALEAVNNSILKIIRDRSEFHAYHERLHPSQQTKQQYLGQALHSAVLEPELFMQEYAVPIKVDRRTKAGKAEWAKWEAAHPNVNLLKAEESIAIQGMRNAILEHPTTGRWIRNAAAKELTVVWTEYGEKCKARVDCIYQPEEEETLVIDIKTAADGSPDGFRRAVSSYDYHMQAAWYLRGLSQIARARRRFIFLVVENTPPFAVSMYEIDPRDEEQAQLEVENAFQRWIEAKTEGIYRGYSLEIQDVGLAAWRRQNPEEIDV